MTGAGRVGLEETGADETRVEEKTLLSTAIRGDADAYARLISPYLPMLRVHCYRMLGSYHDAEDATQETMARAWQSLSSYRGQAPLGHWLYRIATTTCLMAIRARSRRPVTIDDVSYLEPYPDRLLDDLPAAGADPAAAAENRDSVALAFIAALQLLPATQRAVLILRDVLAFTAAEVADLLDTSVPAVNSALQRARSSVSAARGDEAASSRRSLTAADRAVLERFMHAWRTVDIDELTELLHQDAVLRMPPQPQAIQGRDHIGQFFATVPAGGRLDQIRLTISRANGHPALAAYLPDDAGRHQAYGIMVFIIDGSQIRTITGFSDARLVTPFALADTMP